MFTNFFTFCEFFITFEKQEISDGLTQCIGQAMMAYRVSQRELPDRILVYRDGVGDGQLQYIHEHELPQINAYIANEKLHTPGWEPTLAYTVLKKRINQRFFRTNEVFSSARF